VRGLNFVVADGESHKVSCSSRVSPGGSSECQDALALCAQAKAEAKDF